MWIVKKRGNFVCAWDSIHKAVENAQNMANKSGDLFEIWTQDSQGEYRYCTIRKENAVVTAQDIYDRWLDERR